MARTPEQNKVYMARYYANNREVCLEKQKEYAKARLLGPDGDHVRALRTARVQKHRQRNPEETKRWYRNSRAKLKAELFAAYGQECRCCGETNPEFLTLDHVNRDGNVHRAQFGGRNTATSAQIYTDLRRRGWPREGYQILCINCNFATRFGSPCPHTTQLTNSKVQAFLSVV